MTSYASTIRSRPQPHRYLAPFAALLFLPVGLLAQDSAAARRYSENARQLARSDQTDQAIAEYQRAIAADTTDWRHPFALGELLQGRPERWADALVAFRSAWDLGYRRGVTRHKMGISLYEMGQPDSALAEFERAMAMDRAMLDTASSRQAFYLRFQLADSHLWAAKIRLERSEREAAYRLAEAALGYDTVRQHRLRILSLGHVSFGNADYDLAARFYRLSLRDPATGGQVRIRSLDDNPEYRIPATELLEVVENRRRLGQIVPEYTHRALVLFILDQDVEIEQDGRRVRVHRVITERQKREAESRLRWLRQVVESLSEGRYSLSFVLADDSTQYRYQAPTRPAWIGDRRIISPLINEFDTLIRCWPYGEGEGWAGSAPIALAPYGGTARWRGWVSIHPEHSHGVWLHELFHIVEAMAGIRPAHAFRDSLRVNFPGWTGSSQVDYYRWHFRNTLPPLGWANLNFRVRYPVRAQ